MQRQLKEQTLFLAGWVLLITSLPVLSWSTAQVLALYRARWQIELVYKCMKQVLHLNQLRGMRPETNEASILALHEQEAQQARARLAEAAACWQAETAPAAHPGARSDEEGTSAESEQEPPVSSWLLTAVCLQTLRTVVQGYWSLERLRTCLPEQQRFFRGSPRKRQHQESFIRALLLELRGPDPCLEKLVFSCSSA
jgi:Transposase DDE domain